jgi:hypothetical protein
MANENVIFSADGNVVFLPELNAVAYMNDNKGKPQKPTKTVKEKRTGSQVIEYWGSNNLYPQEVVEDYAKDDQIPALIAWKIKTLISGGIIYGNLEFDKDGSEKLIPFYDAEIEDFAIKSALGRFSREAASDFYWFENVFTELILSGDKSKIATITVQEASFCRLAKQREDGSIPYVYISANWEKRPPLANVPKVNLLDPYYDPAGTLQKSEWQKAIYHSSFPSPDSVYYQTPTHNGLRVSGWLDIARAIPEFKKSLMKNQMTIKYHIKIPDSYWPSLYKDWLSLTPEQKLEKKKEKLTQFVNFMKGEKNSGNAFMSDYTYDPINQKPVFGWIIEPIDDKIKDGLYIEDSQEASAHILRAFGLDPTLVGQGPGRNSQSAGSGSDKRVAREIYLLNAKVDQDIILEPLNAVVNPFNGWKKRYPRMTWWFRNYFLATQNQVSPDNRI